VQLSSLQRYLQQQHMTHWSSSSSLVRQLEWISLAVVITVKFQSFKTIAQTSWASMHDIVLASQTSCSVHSHLRRAWWCGLHAAAWASTGSWPFFDHGLRNALWRFLQLLSWASSPAPPMYNPVGGCKNGHHTRVWTSNLNDVEGSSR